MSLRFVCLALIAESPSSGYQIARTIRTGDLRHFAGAAQTTIYTVLKQLESEGCLASEWQMTKGRPDSKVFHLTPQGRSQVSHEVLDEEVDCIVPIIVRFNKHLPTERLRSLVMRRLAAAKERLIELQRDASVRRSDPLAQWLAEYHLAYSRSEVAALSDLLTLVTEGS